MIRHINSFFHRNSRWIFGVFTVIIAFAFVDFMNPGRSGGCHFGGGRSVGTVFGRTVHIDELIEMQKQVNTFGHLFGYGMQRDLSEEALFSQIAYLEAAKRRGITVSDKEVASAIRQMPRFQQNGKFDFERYKAFIRQTEEAGISQDEIEDAIRMMLRIQKLEYSVVEGVVVTDEELAAFQRISSETFTVRRAEFKQANFKDKAQPSQAEQDSYFQQNRKSYRIPAKAEVLVAVFSSNTLENRKKAEEEATVDNLKRFFESNSVLFMEPGKDSKPGTLPRFSAVEKKVKKEFISRRCAEFAMVQARKFARQVYNDNEKDVVETFRTTAKAENIPVVKVGKISADSTKIGKIESPELVRSIFAHIHTIPLSDAVTVKQDVCVAVASQIEKERPAEFAEVKDKVIAACKEESALRAAREEAKAVRAKLCALSPEAATKAVAKDKRFVSVPVFSQDSRPADVNGQYTLMLAVRTPAGQFAEVCPTLDGAILVFVEKRTADDASAKPDALLQERYRMLKAQAMMQEFQETLNRQCKFIQRKND